jgi:putative phage-type endonuclease
LGDVEGTRSKQTKKGYMLMDDQDRQGFIGGSDCADVFSLPPFGCSRRLWYQKTGAEPDYPKEDHFHFKRGKILEPLAATLYMEETGRKVRRNTQRLVDEEYPFMGALLDREILLDERGIGILEVKCPAVRTYNQVKREGISEGYLLQMSHYLRVRKASWGAFCNFSAELAEIHHFDVERDEDLIKKVIEGEMAFWELVKRHEAPEKLLEGDRRCTKCIYQVTCKNITLEDYQGMTVSDATLSEISDPEFEQIMREYWDAKEIRNEAEELLEDAKERILLKASAWNVNRMLVGDSKVYAMEQARNTLDKKALEKEFPGAIAKHTHKGKPFVTLRCYRVKD